MRKFLLTFAALAALLIAAPRGAEAQTETGVSPRLRVIHAAAGATGVDLYLNGQLTVESNDFFSEQIETLTPGEHDVLVAREGDAIDRAITGKRFFATNDDVFTLVLIGSGETVRGLLLKDRTSTPGPGEARVRIIHASDEMGPVNVAVADREPFLLGAVFGTANYIDMPPGTYAFDLSAGDSGAALLRTLELTFNPGWTYTLIVTGDSAENLWVQALVDSPAR
jgi:Domain of unknown function (DUF4397)